MDSVRHKIKVLVSKIAKRLRLAVQESREKEDSRIDVDGY